MSEPDYRSDRSDTNEGKGIARRAWDGYAAAVNKAVGPALNPVVEPAARVVARTMVADLIGFWTIWHLYGGFEGMERYGYSRATIYRKIKRFRRVFGTHPDEWTCAGITLDPKAYWAEAKRRAEAKASESEASTGRAAS